MDKIKKLFASPWKAAVVSIGIVLILVVLFAGTVFAAGVIAQNNAIGSEKAQNFAFADANVDPVTAKVVKTEFDFEHGQFVYEVEFYANDTEYKYWVKADNGEILKKELEINNPNGGSTVLSAEITLEDAKKIALTDAGVSEDQVEFTEEKLDRDNTFSVYALSFFTKDTEYEYEINASTGAVFSKSKETYVTTIPGQTQTGSQQNSTSDKQSDTNFATNTAPEQQTTQNSTGTQSQSSVTLESAKSTALSDAGVNASDATVTKSVLDYDDGRKVYDIEFYANGYEYEYEIDANTGTVFSKNKEVLPVHTTPSQPSNNSQSSTPNSGQSNNQGSSTQNTSGTAVTAETAKSTALSDAGVSASDATFTKAVLDYDDGRKVYDIEFYTSTHEYDYEVNAETGKIIKRDSEAFRVQQGTQGNNAGNSGDTGNYIGVEQAKSIAVSHAGLSMSSVTFKKAKVESDDGYTVYEVEFYSNGIEYDYTIDAVSGTIMEYDSDRD